VRAGGAGRAAHTVVGVGARRAERADLLVARGDNAKGAGGALLGQVGLA
jgi:hypothetical protein